MRGRADASLASRVRTGALWSALSTLLLRVANIGVTAVVAHILSPRDFGVFAVALTAYTIVFSIGELGIGSCLTRADMDIDRMAPTMVTISVLSSAALAAVMALAAPQIAAALGSSGGAGAVRVMALVMFVNGFFAVPSAQLTRDLAQGRLFLANAVSLVPSTLVLFVLAKTGGGALAFAWSRVAAQAVMGVVMLLSVPRIYRPGLARFPVSVLLRFGLPLAGANLVYFVLVNVDYVFVGHLTGPAGLGTYMLAFNLASVPGLLLGTVINSVAMPAFSRVKDDPGRIGTAVAGALRAVCLIVMPICGLLMVLARPLVLTVYGARWAPAADVVSVLALYGAVSVICILFGNLLTSFGKANSALVIQLCWLGVLIPAMAVGVHADGIVGAAVAHLAVIGPVVLPLYLLAIRRVARIRLGMLVTGILPSVVLASLASFAAWEAASAFTEPLPRLAAGLAAGGLIYAVAAAPEALALVSEERARKLRALRFYRFYGAVAPPSGAHAGPRENHPSTRPNRGYAGRHGTRNVSVPPSPRSSGENLEVPREA